jgi:dTDP-4-dehydrorhamnose reductase
LAKLSNKYHFRLIHISTDCIFSGLKGNYAENDTPDATDLYGKTKLLGEINYKNAVTIRTSVIGHEVSTTQGLLDWFLSQSGVVKGFEKAIFSGLTNIELAKIIYKTIIPNYNLKGIYHISGETISKYRLLLIIKKIYNMKNIVIISEKKKKINRSLNSNYFKNETGYKSPAWLKMIKEMHKYYYDFKN